MCAESFYAQAEGLRGIPLDPTGVPYVLDVKSGTIDVDRGLSPLWPLPWEPGAAAKPPS